jgi:hypothetical protein
MLDAANVMVATAVAAAANQLEKISMIDSSG